MRRTSAELVNSRLVVSTSSYSRVSTNALSGFQNSTLQFFAVSKANFLHFLERNYPATNMSMSMPKRTAPLSLLCCGVQNGGGGGGGFRFASTVQDFSPKREEELDGCTDVEARESHLQLENLEKETREILSQFYRSHVGLSGEHSRLNKKAHPALATIQRLVEKLLCNHRIAYNGIVGRLFEQVNGLDSVDTVLRGVFSDGVISWGRVASVLSMGAVVCERLKQNCVKGSLEECVDIVTFKISSFITTELQQWFLNNNSWDGFVEFFRIPDPESSVRNTLMAVAGLGIGACLLTLMR